MLLLTRYGLVVVNALYQIYPHLPFSALRAALPIPLGGVLLTVLFNARLAFAGSLSLTILTGLMLAAPMAYFMFTFVGSLVGIFALAGRQERTAFFRAGGAIGVANAYTLTAFAPRPQTCRSYVGTASIFSANPHGLLEGLLARGDNDLTQLRRPG